MNKFRRLTTDELAHLQQEFIQFLILNGLDAENWEYAKVQNPDQASVLIDQFSEVIFSKLISKIEYVEYISSKDLKVFKCDQDEIHLIGLECLNEMDFSQNDVLVNALKSNPEDFAVYHTSKKYMPNREAELFRMIESGAIISDHFWYEVLQKLI